MANKNTNPGGGKDDNEMRIQFGLILALCQNCAISHNPLFHAQNSNLFKGLSPEIPSRYWPCRSVESVEEVLRTWIWIVGRVGLTIA